MCLNTNQTKLITAGFDREIIIWNIENKVDISRVEIRRFFFDVTFKCCQYSETYNVIRTFI